MQMRKVFLIHISSNGCCNPLVTMLNNGNFGFPYSLLPRFPPLQSGAAFSTPAFSVAPLIELFLLGVTTETLRAKIDRKSAILLQRSHFDAKFHVQGVAPTNHFLHG